MGSMSLLGRRSEASFTHRVASGARQDFVDASAAERESDAAHRGHQRLARRLHQLSTQVADMDIDHVAIRVEVHVPNLLEEGRAANDLLGVEQKVLEQLKFLGREIQSLIVHHCDVTQPIQGDRAITQHLETFRTASDRKSVV